MCCKQEEPGANSIWSQGSVFSNRISDSLVAGHYKEKEFGELSDREAMNRTYRLLTEVRHTFGEVLDVMMAEKRPKKWRYCGKSLKDEEAS